MKMSTIKVVSTQNDVILGQQSTVIEIPVPSSKIQHAKSNKKAKKSVAPAKYVTPNRLYRETENETKTVPMDANIDTDIKIKEAKSTKSDEYTDSNQITKKRKARDSKNRPIQSPRRTGREAKEKIQNITSLQNTDGITDRIDKMLEVFDAHRAALLANAKENQK